MMNTPTGMAHSAKPMGTALRLETLTIAWMVVEATVSIGAGVMAQSVLLIAFGADSVLELASACLLYWRLWREAKARLEEAEAIEPSSAARHASAGICCTSLRGTS